MLILTFSATAIKCFNGNKETNVATDCPSYLDRCLNATLKATSVTTYSCSSKETMELAGAEDDKCKDVGIGITAVQYCLCKADKCNFDSSQSGNEAKGAIKCFEGNQETRVVTDCSSSYDRCVNVTIKDTSVTSYICASNEHMKLIGADDDKCTDIGIGDSTAQYCLCKTDKCNFDSPQSGNVAKGLLTNYLLISK